MDDDPIHSTNPPAPPLPTEPTVNKTQTDNTVTTQSEAEDKVSLLCTVRRHCYY